MVTGVRESLGEEFRELTGPTHSCPICDARMAVVDGSLPGYVEGTSFAILDCTSCHLGQAYPTSADPSFYEMVYHNKWHVPGYSRYWYYRDFLLHHPKKGLEFLSSFEPCYWGVRRTLEEEGVRQDTRVLDVGSGLGYLTAVLRRGGLEAWGLEMSADAVRAAQAAFGPWYIQGSVEHGLSQLRGSFDLVLMIELIEHVDDPARLIEQAFSLVRPGGRLLVTTPNKSYFPSETWRTDPPPNHLWWFSEQSISRLADKLRLHCRFLDQTEYYRIHPGDRTPPQLEGPVLGSDGTCLKRESYLRRGLRATGSVQLARSLRDLTLRATARIAREGPGSHTAHRGPDMCAIFSEAK
jgi:SAM-dependent methyltransferase